MNLPLVTSIAKYFAVQSVLFFIELENVSMRDFTELSVDIQLTWCVHESCHYNVDEQELIVCDIESECVKRFQKIPPPKRKSLIFLFLSSDEVVAEKLDNIRFDDNILVVDQSSGVIRELYAIKGQAFETKLGTYNFTTNSLLATKLSKWERRDNLGGAKFLVTILHWFPVSINVTAESDNGTVAWDGFMVNILEILRHDLNFTIEYVSPQDGVWGAKVIFNFFFH